MPAMPSSVHAAAAHERAEPLLESGKPNSSEATLGNPGSADPEKPADNGADNGADDGAADELRGRIDGGRMAWQVVLASFLVHFAAFGIQYSFGVFQAWYLANDFKDKPGVTPSSMSLVGSLGPCAMFVMGLFVGRIAESVGYRPVILAGAVFIGGGVFLASFATQLWHLALTQGILYGIGCALVYFPAIALPTQWWAKKRATAVGIAVAGSGVGGLAVANAVAALLPAIGTAWTLRVLGISAFAICAVAAALAQTRIPRRRASGPAVKRPIIDFSMLRNPNFPPLLVGSVLIPFGFLVPYFFMPLYVKEIVGAQPSFAALLLTLLNVASIVGRIVTGFVADKLGHINTFIISLQLTGVSVLALWLPAGDSQGMLMAFAICYGLFAGGFISLNPTVTAQLFGIEKLPSVLGLLYAATAVGNLAGNPLAGALITGDADATWSPSKQYGGAIVYAGVIMIAGTAGTLYLRFFKLDRRLWVAL